MKKSLMIILLISLLAAICAFSAPQKPDDPDIELQDRTNEGALTGLLSPEEFFDSEQLYKPSDVSVKTVQLGMTCKEIAENLGKPHSCMLAGRDAVLIWYTQENHVAEYSFFVKEEPSEDVFRDLLNYPSYSVVLRQGGSDDPYAGILWQEQTDFPCPETNSDDRKDWFTYLGKWFPVVDFFDWDRTHLPSDEDTKKVYTGMALSDAVRLLGKPHDLGPFSGLFVVVWDTLEGHVFSARVVLVSDSDGDIYNEMMKRGMVYLPELKENELPGTTLWKEDLTPDDIRNLFPDPDWVETPRITERPPMPETEPHDQVPETVARPIPPRE